MTEEELATLGGEDEDEELKYLKSLQKFDEFPDLKPGGVLTTAGRALKRYLPSAIATAAGGVAGGTIGAAAGPVGAIGGDIAGGMAAGALAEKKRREWMGDKAARREELQLELDKMENPFASEIGAMTGKLPAFLGGGAGIFREGKEAAKIAGTAFKPSTMQAVGEMAKGGARMGGSEELSHQLTEGGEEGLNYDSLADAIARGAITMGPLGFVSKIPGLGQEANTLIGKTLQQAGHAASASQILSHANALYDSVKHTITDGKEGRPYDETQTFKQGLADIPAFFALGMAPALLKGRATGEEGLQKENRQPTKAESEAEAPEGAEPGERPKLEYQWQRPIPEAPAASETDARIRALRAMNIAQREGRKSGVLGERAPHADDLNEDGSHQWDKMQGWTNQKLQDVHDEIGSRMAELGESEDPNKGDIYNALLRKVRSIDAELSRRNEEFPQAPEDPLNNLTIYERGLATKKKQFDDEPSFAGFEYPKDDPDALHPDSNVPNFRKIEEWSDPHLDSMIKSYENLRDEAADDIASNPNHATAKGDLSYAKLRLEQMQAEKAAREQYGKDAVTQSPGEGEALRERLAMEEAVGENPIQTEADPSQFQGLKPEREAAARMRGNTVLQGIQEGVKGIAGKGKDSIKAKKPVKIARSKAPAEPEGFKPAPEVHETVHAENRAKAELDRTIQKARETRDKSKELERQAAVFDERAKLEPPSDQGGVGEAMRAAAQKLRDDAEKKNKEADDEVFNSHSNLEKAKQARADYEKKEAERIAKEKEDAQKAAAEEKAKAAADAKSKAQQKAKSPEQPKAEKPKAKEQKPQKADEPTQASAKPQAKPASSAGRGKSAARAAAEKAQEPAKDSKKAKPASRQVAKETKSETPEAPKPAKPKKAKAKPEPPKAEAPKAEQPKTEAPKPKEPEAPKEEAPKETSAEEHPDVKSAREDLADAKSRGVSEGTIKHLQKLLNEAITKHGGQSTEAPKPESPQSNGGPQGTSKAKGGTKPPKKASDAAAPKPEAGRGKRSKIEEPDLEEEIEPPDEADEQGDEEPESSAPEQPREEKPKEPQPPQSTEESQDPIKPGTKASIVKGKVYTRTADGWWRDSFGQRVKRNEAGIKLAKLLDEAALRRISKASESKSKPEEEPTSPPQAGIPDHIDFNRFPLESLKKWNGSLWSKDEFGDWTNVSTKLSAKAAEARELNSLKSDIKSVEHIDHGSNLLNEARKEWLVPSEVNSVSIKRGPGTDRYLRDKDGTWRDMDGKQVDQATSDLLDHKAEQKFLDRKDFGGSRIYNKVGGEWFDLESGRRITNEELKKELDKLPERRHRSIEGQKSFRGILLPEGMDMARERSGKPKLPEELQWDESDTPEEAKRKDAEREKLLKGLPPKGYTVRYRGRTMRIDLPAEKVEHDGKTYTRRESYFYTEDHPTKSKQGMARNKATEKDIDRENLSHSTRDFWFDENGKQVTGKRLKAALTDKLHQMNAEAMDKSKWREKIDEFKRKTDEEIKIEEENKAKIARETASAVDEARREGSIFNKGQDMTPDAQKIWKQHLINEVAELSGKSSEQKPKIENGKPVLRPDGTPVMENASDLDIYKSKLQSDNIGELERKRGELLHEKISQDLVGRTNSKGERTWSDKEISAVEKYLKSSGSIEASDELSKAIGDKKVNAVNRLITDFTKTDQQLSEKILEEIREANRIANEDKQSKSTPEQRQKRAAARVRKAGERASALRLAADQLKAQEPKEAKSQSTESGTDKPPTTIKSTKLKKKLKKGGFIDDLVIKHAIDSIKAGARNFIDFAKSMIAKFGDGIRKFVADVWDVAKSAVVPKEVREHLDNPNVRHSGLGAALGSVNAKIGESRAPEPVRRALRSAEDSMKMASSIRDVAKPIREFGGEQQQAQMRAEKFAADVWRHFKSNRAARAATVYLEAKEVAREEGSTPEEVIQRWAQDINSSSDKNIRRYGVIYNDALRLGDEALEGIKKITARYKELGEVMEKEGFLGAKAMKAGSEGYAYRRVKRPRDARGQMRFNEFNQNLARNFNPAKLRTFGTMHEVLMSGLEPESFDIVKNLALYDVTAHDTLNYHKMIRGLLHTKNEHGQPYAIIRNGRDLGMKPDEKDVRLVDPAEANEEWTVDREHIHGMEHINDPRFLNWKYKTPKLDEDGNPVMENGQKVMVVRHGDLAFTPEVAKLIRNNIKNSAIRQWYNSPSESGLAEMAKRAVSTADVLNRMIKTGMFSGSPFHATTLGVRAMGHGVNPFKDMISFDEKNENHVDALNHGLMLYDTQHRSDFREGSGGRIDFREGPDYLRGVKKLAGAVSDFTFDRLMPSLKLKAYDAALRRNMERFGYKDAGKSESGLQLWEPAGPEPKFSQDQVKLLTGEQINDSFGHQNRFLKGSDPTIEHIMSLALLAPDFFRSTFRQTLSGMKGLVGNKTGKEQTMALALIAGGAFASARAMNALLNNGDTKLDWEHLFSITAGGRDYSLRTVPGDLVNLIHDPRRHLTAKMSPISKLGFQAASGKNYRGETMSNWENAKEFGIGGIPIAMRDLPGVNQLTETTKNNPVSVWEGVLKFLGANVKRNSPITHTYKLAAEWKADKGKPDSGSYPISKYTPFKSALEDLDMERAKQEWDKLISKSKEEGFGKTRYEAKNKLAAGLRQSLDHPFTDNVSDEREFYRSLNAAQKAQYQEAVKLRKAIWYRASKIMGAYPGALTMTAIPMPR